MRAVATYGAGSYLEGFGYCNATGVKHMSPEKLEFEHHITALLRWVDAQDFTTIMYHNTDYCRDLEELRADLHRIRRRYIPMALNTSMAQYETAGLNPEPDPAPDPAPELRNTVLPALVAATQRGRAWLEFTEKMKKRLDIYSFLRYDGGISNEQEAAMLVAGMFDSLNTARLYQWLTTLYAGRFSQPRDAFTPAVLRHIEDYAVAQYGDTPDQGEDLTYSTNRDALLKYLKRMGSGQRGAEESKRDILKMAHYLQLCCDTKPQDKDIDNATD